MKRFFTLLLLIFTLNQVNSQKLPAYKLFNDKGKKSCYKKMKKAVEGADYVFFGEYHDNPIAHWLTFVVMEDMYAIHGNSLKLAFEMFEQDQQLLLNDYIQGIISDKMFEDSCRLWPNYETDYKPLLMFAKEHKLFCLASNVPRRYASMLFKKDRGALDSLSSTDKSYMAPLDFKIDTTLSQYAELKMMEAHMGGGNLLEAQALKDATMAHFLYSNKQIGDKYLHVNGAYHSDYYQGIIWYLKLKDPTAKIVTISTVTQDDIQKLEEDSRGRADFIICVPEKMTRTH